MFIGPIWLSPDVSSVVYHYDIGATSLTRIGTHSVSGLIGNCGNSGIAVGGEKLYLANNGCSEIYEVKKDFSSSVLFASFPARLEDMECDPITFKPQGKDAIWNQDAYDRVLNAWEIPAGLCGFVGLPEPTPTPSPSVTPIPPTATPRPTPTPLPVVKGEMTGGGSVFTQAGARVTHGMNLDCDPTAKSNLEVNWDKGNNFKLAVVTSAACSDTPGLDPGQPPATFDTHQGSGAGTCNGLPAQIKWRFTDAGEPGKDDTAEISIAGGCTLSVAGKLDNGNHQAHNK